MKLFRLLTTTAITTMAVAAMAVSASAALEATYTAPTTDAAGSVALTGIETTAEQKTLLILNNDATNVVDTDIVQIDQDETLTSVAVGDLAAAIDAANQDLLDEYNKIASPTKADFEALKADWKASTNYYVRVGGDGSIEKYTLEVKTTKEMPEAPAEVPPTPTYTLGDVTGEGNIDGEDALQILKYSVKLVTDFGDVATEAGDVTGEGNVDGEDALQVLKYSVKLITSFK